MMAFAVAFVCIGATPDAPYVVESRYPGTMKKLNAAMRNHTFYDSKFWKGATGKTAEELEADWKSDVSSAAATPKVEDFKVKR